MNWESIATAAAALIAIGAFHPIVIKCEYYLSAKAWPIFLVAGLILMGAALFTDGFLSIALSILGAGSLWSIHELKKQEKRVEKGWFPENPARKTKPKKAERGEGAGSAQ